MIRHIATLLPAAGDVSDAAELTRAASELGPLVALILGATALFIAQRGLEALRPARAVTPAWQLLALFLGLLALWLLRQLPFAGGLIGFVALVAGIGALAWRAWNGRGTAAA